MPAEMAMEKAVARIRGEPRGEKTAGCFQLAALVTNMGEAMRPMRVVRVRGNRSLDDRPGRRKLAILGQRHGVIGQEPEIVAVVRREAVHQFRDLVLLADAAGAADQAVGVRRNGDHQRIARPCRQMRIQGGDRGVGPAGKHEVEERDVTGLALRQAGSEALGCRQRRRAAATSPCLISICALPAWARAKPGSAAMARS